MFGDPPIDDAGSEEIKFDENVANIKCSVTMDRSLKKSINLKANTNTNNNANSNSNSNSSHTDSFSQELNTYWSKEPAFHKSTFLKEWCKAKLGHPTEHSLIISQGKSGYIDLSTINDIKNFPEYIRLCNTKL